MIPLFPELVDKISLKGVVTYEDEDVIVLMKKRKNPIPETQPNDVKPIPKGSQERLNLILSKNSISII